ncbi:MULTISPECIES: TRAP transporter small permease [unclassified Agarivorans]|uniref:TRAP transporter small permease n=1 Tax=unclassified Agarivorans TaxID=2636026 RepID=UPI003D7D5042
MKHAILERFANLMLAIAVIAFSLNLLTLFYGVCARYLLNSAPIWTDEFSRFVIIATVMLAAGAVYLRDEHMRVSIIERYLPVKLNRVLHWYRWLLILTIAGFFSYTSAHYAISLSRFHTMGLGISKTIPSLSLPIGFAVLFVLALLRGPYPNKGALS